MDIQKILKDVENTIHSPQERGYFLIHEARYAYILEQINKLTIDKLTTKQNTLDSRVRGNNKRKRILDVGCYPYHLGKALELMGHEVWGISSTHEPVKHENIKTCNIETDTFPFKDDFFDMVIFTEVLEHLPQSPLHALNEMRRVAKPGGTLILTTPNITRSINRLKILLGKNVSYPLAHLLENDGNGDNLYHRHNREYTLKEVKTLVKHADWHIEKAEYFVSYTPFRRRTVPDKPWMKAGKTANFVLMNILASMRDTLLVVGKK